MKRVLIIMIGFVIFVGRLNSQTYDATIEQMINGSFLDVSLYLEHTGTTSPVLGDCSFYVSYDNSALSNAVLQSDGQWDEDQNTGYGQNAVSRNHTLGIASIEVVMTGSPTYVIPDAKTLLGTIRFDIDNTSLNSGIQWNATYTEVWDDGDQDIAGDGDFQNPPDFSLPVQMTSLTATVSQEEGVTLLWSTQSELNCAGFHVWKATEENGTYEQVTNELIPGQGSSSAGQDYEYCDKDVEDGVLYWYKVQELSTTDDSHFHGPVSVMGVAMIPKEYGLSQNYPNPFNPETTMDYQIIERNEVIITIYNLIGHRVKTIVKTTKEPGFYKAKWDGKDERGIQVSGGIYFARILSGEFSDVKKMVLLK